MGIVSALNSHSTDVIEAELRLRVERHAPEAERRAKMPLCRPPDEARRISLYDGSSTCPALVRVFVQAVVATPAEIICRFYLAPPSLHAWARHPRQLLVSEPPSETCSLLAEEPRSVLRVAPIQSDVWPLVRRRIHQMGLKGI